MSKRVLVTGGAGFIAHNLIKEILERTDWEVVSLDRLDFSSDINRLTEVIGQLGTDRLQIVYHDLKSEINSSIDRRIGHVDYILHLAAGSHVDRSIDEPMLFVQDNVVGTCNILNFARTRNIEKFVYFSTDEVFGPAPEGVFFDEYDRYNSSNPYSASKAGGEELAVAFQNTYKMPIIITHTMNVFGERQALEKYIPLCIGRVLRGETITIHSDETRTKAGQRHYIHNSDVADAMLFLLEKEYSDFIINEPEFKVPKFNIVGREEVDNLEVAKLVAQYVGKELKYEMTDFHSSRPGHDLRYALSGERMKQLGWVPKVSFRERLQSVVQWYMQNPHWL